MRRHRPTDQRNAWWRGEWVRLKRERGDRCEQCGAEWGLQFAHVRPTKLSGHNGRGFNHRVKDVREHPESYRLLCPTCHVD